MVWRRAEEGERWKQVVHDLVDVVVDAILEHDPARAVADVTDEEVQARGRVALRALNQQQNGAHAHAPLQWDWGRKRWINPVRQALARRVKRRSDEEAAAFLAGLRGESRQIPPRDATTATPERFIDVEDGKHPGWMLVPDVFNDAEVTDLRALKKTVKKHGWVHLFNSATWEPSDVDTARICAALKSKKRSTSYEGVVMPRKREGWSVDTDTSAFRQQAHVGTEEVEEWILERLRPYLPENAVFPPPGSRTYMIRNVRDAARTASRDEQPMHYDFPPGLRRLGVIISLHDSVYLAVGDRWSEDVSKVCMRVNIPKGSVLIFANSVPHAGMGDVNKDGCERLHLYVGLGCTPEEVHPVGDDGNLATYLASQESASRMNIAKAKRRSR
jgi:hypothetical protein